MKVPTPLPRIRSEIPKWHLKLTEKVLFSTARKDYKEKDFLDSCLKLSLQKPKQVKAIDRVPRKHFNFDLKLKSNLEEEIEKHDKVLHDKIQRHRTMLSAKGIFITLRRVLCMFYQSMEVDSSLLGVITIATLNQMKWKDYGDSRKRADEYLNTWIERIARLENPLDEVRLRDILHQQMRQTKNSDLKLALRDYKKLTPKEKTHDKLISVFHEWLHEGVKAENLEKSDQILQQEAVKAGGKPPLAKALVAKAMERQGEPKVTLTKEEERKETVKVAAKEKERKMVESRQEDSRQEQDRRERSPWFCGKRNVFTTSPNGMEVFDARMNRVTSYTHNARRRPSSRRSRTTTRRRRRKRRRSSRERYRGDAPEVAGKVPAEVGDKEVGSKVAGNRHSRRERRPRTRKRRVAKPQGRLATGRLVAGERKERRWERQRKESWGI